jgi:3-oxoacyl-[acyl-carrier-protein] synthase I
MSTPPVVIVGAGVVSPVGLSASETAASVRSGVMRFAPVPILDGKFEPFTLSTAPEDGLPALVEALRERGLTTRESRMVRLAAGALGECLGLLPPLAGAPPLALALPEAATTRPLDGALFAQWLTGQVNCRFDEGLSDCSFRGRAGGILAIDHAATLIRTGHAQLALAGGVDSFRDPYVLARLDTEKRVKSSANLDGFIPGEGAAFLALASDAAARSFGLPPMATLSAAGVGFETGHLYSEEPYRGDGLATAITTLLQSGAVTAPIRAVFSSMNGESHWAKEWGVGFLRNRDAFLPEHSMHHPADCTGDVGAAFGPLAVALAALGVRGGYRDSPCLVYGSSDRGSRAALAVVSA